MSVSKDNKTGKWMAQIRIENWKGEVIHKKKRVFKTKKRDWSGKKPQRKHILQAWGCIFKILSFCTSRT